MGWFVHKPSGVAMTSQAGIPVIASDYFINLEVWTALPAATLSARPPAPELAPAADKVYVSLP